MVSRELVGLGKMVYCTKCGAKNENEAATCSKCGASLGAVGDREYYRRVERECFGIPGGGAIVGVAIGVIILLWGLIWIMQQAALIPENVSIWPFAFMIFGLLIVIGALYGRRRRY